MQNGEHELANPCGFTRLDCLDGTSDEFFYADRSIKINNRSARNEYLYNIEILFVY